MSPEDEKWTWVDVLALIISVVWAIQYTAGIFVKGYSVSIEVTMAMGAVLGALGFTTPRS